MVGDDNTLLPSSFSSKSTSMMMVNDHDVSTRSAVVVDDNYNHFNYFDHHSSSISGVNYLSNAGYLFGTDQLSVKAVDHVDNSKDDVLAEHQNVPHHRDGDDDDDCDDGGDDDSESPDRVVV